MDRIFSRLSRLNFIGVKCSVTCFLRVLASRTMTFVGNVQLPTSVNLISDENHNQYDSVVLVSTGCSADSLKGYAANYFPTLKFYKEVDEAIDKDVSVLGISEAGVPIKRLVYTPTGPLNRDYDDVRRFSDAACKGIKRALKAGSKKPLIGISVNQCEFHYYSLVTLLGALEALYVPLEIREALPEKKSKADTLGIANYSGEVKNSIISLAVAIESGRLVCRDIGGSDPERMAAPNVANYVQQVFAETCVKVEIIKDQHTISEQFPLLAAVNRAARNIERHQARVIFLTYDPEGPVDTTLVLVGKGVTYDTGGADIKAGGVMAGMHRDKCGAAAVAGFFQVLAALKPKRIRVLGGMSMVRNSVGHDCYVSDEIITSRCGVRVRVGNTDAEGRMAMADVLNSLKDKVVGQADPHIFTIATLTGHACLTVGDGYSIVVENGPARKSNVGALLQKAGDDIGDMFEISTLRREDYQFHQGKSEYEDVLQCNNLPSSRTPRGHQSPAAFLSMASGLDKHGLDSATPLKYCHIDIAGSSGPFPGIPSGSPIAALVKQFVMDRI